MTSPGKAIAKARQAFSEARYHDAQQFLGEGLAGLKDGTAEDNAIQQARIHRELARVCDRLEEWVDALIHADAAIQWSQQAGDSLEEAKARLRAGEIAFKNGRWAQAERHFDAAQKVAQLAPEIQWRACEGLARIRWRTGQARSALRLVARGIEHARQGEDTKAHALLEATGASLRHEVGEWEEAVSGFARAIELFRSLDEPYHLARNLNTAGEVYLAMGQVDRALGTFEESISVALASANTRGIIYASLNRANCLARLGQLEDAEEVVNQLTPLIDASEEQLVTAFYDQTVACLMLEQEHDGEALMLLEEVDRIYRELDVPFDRARNNRIWAVALARTGNPTAAVAKLDATEKLYRDLGADCLARIVATERARIA